MMDDDQSVTVTCNGEEVLSWIFEFPQQDDDAPGRRDSGEDGADRRRDDNLREMFGG